MDIEQLIKTSNIQIEPIRNAHLLVGIHGDPIFVPADTDPDSVSGYEQSDTCKLCTHYRYHQRIKCTGCRQCLRYQQHINPSLIQIEGVKLTCINDGPTDVMDRLQNQLSNQKNIVKLIHHPYWINQLGVKPEFQEEVDQRQSQVDADNRQIQTIRDSLHQLKKTTVSVFDYSLAVTLHPHIPDDWCQREYTYVLEVYYQPFTSTSKLFQSLMQ